LDYFGGKTAAIEKSVPNDLDRKLQQLPLETHRPYLYWKLPKQVQLF
jgi:hypothetical protein